MFASEKLYPNFQHVSFVSASTTDGGETVTHSDSITKFGITGEEACCFYNEVISSPSTVILSSDSDSRPKRKKNPDFSKYRNSRMTIIHYSHNGDIEGIKYCLSKGCKIDEADIFGWTSLMCAASQGHYIVAEYLIKNGANLEIKNKQGQTALDVAILKNNFSLIQLLSEGLKEPMPKKVVKQEDLKFCDICRCSFSESEVTHKSSIAHLLSHEKRDSATFYHIPENNKGFQIMLKKGWDKNRGLGANAKGRKFPIKTVLKSDRTCIGGKKEKAKITHFGPNDDSSVTIHNQPKVKIVRERIFKKWKTQKEHNKNRQKEINFRRQFNMD